MFTLDKIFEAEIAVEEMKVGLQQVDTRFFIFLISLTALDIKCHQETSLSLDKIFNLQIQDSKVSDTVGVVQAFLVLFVEIEGAGICSYCFVPLSDLEIASAQATVNVR